MLEQVGNVNWRGFFLLDSKSNIDLPQTLIQLATSSSEKREDAEKLLLDCVFPRNPTVIPATIPFLLDIVQEKTVSERWRILQLINAVIDYSGDWIDLSSEDGFQLLQAIYRAYREGRLVYFQCLSDPDPNLRASAAHSVALCDEASAFATLTGRLQIETDAFVMRAIMVALKRICVPEVTASLSPFLEHPDLGVRTQAAVVIGELAEGIVPTEAWQVLVENATLPSVEGQIAFEAIQCFGSTVFSKAVPTWLRILPTTFGDTLDAIVSRLLFAAFSHKTPWDARLSSSELNFTQRAIIQGLLDTPHIWEPSSGTASQNINHCLSVCGLPGTCEELVRLIRNSANVDLM